MLDYAHQRVIEALRIHRRAVFVTSGPAGLQAGEFPCQAIVLDVYLLVPRTSDHLFNIEQDPHAILLTDRWELKGEAQVIPLLETGLPLDLVQEPEAEWCFLVRVKPYQVHIRMEKGWGNLETIDIEIPRSASN